MTEIICGRCGEKFSAEKENDSDEYCLDCMREMAMPTLKELLEANSYQIKVDKYPFTDEYETILGIQEALMSVKGWLLQERQKLQDTQNSIKPHYDVLTQEQIFALDALLEELKDVFIPVNSQEHKEGQ